jgi:hypothetical protein
MKYDVKFCGRDVRVSDGIAPALRNVASRAASQGVAKKSLRVIYVERDDVVWIKFDAANGVRDVVDDGRVGHGEPAHFASVYLQ